LAFAVPGVLMREPWGPALLVLVMLLVAGNSVWALLRRQDRELSEASGTSRLMETVFSTSREWLWTIGPDETFTFSGPMGRELVGYDATELLGKHFSHVIDPEDLARAQRNKTACEGPDSSWSGLVAVCRHRDGSRVLVEVSGRPIIDGQGQVCGFEGTTRALDRPTANALAAEEALAGVEATLASRTLLTAFQPIYVLDTGTVIGAEALTRFLSPKGHGISPEVWFVEAASVGLGVDLGNACP
jgi:PAS domain S-box-containing protein